MLMGRSKSRGLAVRTRLGFVLVAMCLFWVFGVIKLIEYIHSQWYLSTLDAIKLIEYIHSPLNPKGLASHRWPL
jgi:hypothetical protein